MITQWNESEDDALQDLPLRAQIIYLRGLRRYMNYKTGITGEAERRISLRMLEEIAGSYFNRQKITPNKKEVIVSLDQLKAVGLIERVEDKDYLIFFLPKADTNKSVQNNHGTTTAQPRHNHGTEYGISNPSELAACEDNHDTQKNSCDLDLPLTTAHISNTGNQVTDIKPKAKALVKKSDWIAPEELNTSAWAEYEQHRKDIKKPLTDGARTKQANKLITVNRDAQQRIIDYSIGAGYPDLYMDKAGSQKPQAKVINGNFQSKDYGQTECNLPGWPG